MAPARKTLQINNLCELILGGESGDYLYLQSRGRSQFLDMRDATCQTLKPRSRYKMDSKSFCPVICPKVQLWEW